MEALSIANLVRKLLNVLKDKSIFTLPALVVTMQLLNELFVSLFFDKHLEVLDLLIVVSRALSDVCDSSQEYSSLCLPSVVHKAPFLDHFGQLSLKHLHLGDKLLLNLCVLDFDYG